MTAPNKPDADGAYVIGDHYGSEVPKDKPAVEQFITAPARQALEKIVASMLKFDTDLKITRANHYDGQNQLKNRTDLLNNVSGYGSAFMGYNWDVPHSRWVVMPFDTQLGPVKGVAVDGGNLVLKKGGLWRVDAHATSTGYTLNQTIIPLPNPPFFMVKTEYNPIIPQYILEVLNADGSVFTQRKFDSVPNMSFAASGLVGGVNAPASAAFSHTFVLPNMPPESDPAAAESWKRVRVVMSYQPVNAGQLNYAYCTLKGGTMRSSLIASRWSRDTTNQNLQPTVPDGGNLG